MEMKQQLEIQEITMKKVIRDIHNTCKIFSSREVVGTKDSRERERVLLECVAESKEAD